MQSTKESKVMAGDTYDSLRHNSGGPDFANKKANAYEHVLIQMLDSSNLSYFQRDRIKSVLTVWSNGIKQPASVDPPKRNK